MSEPRTDTVRADQADSEVAALRREVEELGLRLRRYEAALQALANFSLIEDRHPTHRDDRYRNTDDTKYDVLKNLLDKKPADVTEAVYMLATYCFDLSRRFAFVNASVTKALPKGVEADKSLREAIDKDDHDLHDPKLTGWQDRARVSGEQLKAWHKKAHELLVQYTGVRLPR